MKTRKYRKKNMKTLDTMFSKYIRAKDGKCLRCGKTTTLQLAHIIGRRNMRLRYDPMNALTLCYACHIFWSHKEPLLFAEWVKEEFPEKYYYVMDHRNEHEKLDYDATYEALKSLSNLVEIK